MNKIRNTGFTPLEVFNKLSRIAKESRRRVRFWPFFHFRRSAELLTGFTIFETVVVAGIMTLVGSLIFANYSGAGDRFVTKSVAEGIASSIRQTQAYGLGVREFGLNSEMFPGYGIYFDISTPTSYVIFADSTPDFSYGGSGERVITEYLQTGITIYDLCVNEKAGGGNCNPATLAGIYLRPDPTVTLKGGVSPTCSGAPAGTWCDIEVKIQGKKGTTKTIVLWRSGQVSVE